MGAIRVLPPQLVDRIAAGEVVERPQSVVKELVENALDAGAGTVRVELEEGGRRRIRVIDDGRGMDRDDLALAWVSHATSKLADEEELFRIRTLGFRGEALASIGSIAQARIVSRTADSDAAAEIENHGGRMGELRAAAGPRGTLVEVDHLFFNVPVRKKFLRSPSVELGRVLETFTGYALGRLDVRFEMIHDAAPLHVLPPARTFTDRVASFYGAELARDLLPSAAAEEGVRVEAWLAPPSRTATHGGMQHFFLNGRYVKDRLLYRAVGEAYRDLLPPPKRYPIVFLFVTVPPEEVDVNVHPTKLEVRFRNPWRLQDFVVRTFAATLAKSPRFELAPRQAFGSFVDSSPDLRHRQLERAMVDFFSRPVPQERGGPGGEPNAGGGGSAYAAPATTHGTAAAALATSPSGTTVPWATTPAPAAPYAPAGGFPAPVPAGSFAPGAGTPVAMPAAPIHPAPIPPVGMPGPELLPLGVHAGPDHRFVQLHDRYILEEEPDGLVLIDQHALHERILAYEIKKRLDQAEALSQALLLPAVLELPPRLRVRLEEARPTLTQAGFRIEPFGRDAHAVQAVPTFLGDRDPVRYLTELLEDMADRSEHEVLADRRSDLIDMMACKAAIKAGQRLPPEEIRNLLALRHRYAHTLTCPHGRPTTLRLSLAELERHFHRR